MERIRKRRRRGRPATPSTLTEALELLAAFYHGGHRQAADHSDQGAARWAGLWGCRAQPLAFAEAAMAPLFPDAGSLVGNWRKLIKKGSYQVSGW